MLIRVVAKFHRLAGGSRRQTCLWIGCGPAPIRRIIETETLARISHQEPAGWEANARRRGCRGAIHRARLPTYCTLGDVQKLLPRAVPAGPFASSPAGRGEKCGLGDCPGGSFSVSSGDGGNPSPSGEAKLGDVVACATMSQSVRAERSFSRLQVGKHVWPKKRTRKATVPLG